MALQLLLGTVVAEMLMRFSRASRYPNGEVRLWRLSDGSHLCTLAGHRSPVIAVRFSTYVLLFSFAVRSFFVLIVC